MAAKSGSYIPAKGDLVWLDFSPQAGREQAGHRPALVMSSARYNRSGLMFACPVTSQVKNYPFEVPVKVKKIDGVVLADHLKNVDWQDRNARFIARAPQDVIDQTFKLFSAILTQD